MNLLFQFLRNNVDPELWNKCHEDLLTAPVPCQSGPLMLFLILKRLHNCSESTLELLLLKVRNLKIHEHEGEDIDTIVRLVNTAVNLLKHSSTDERAYITHDFSRDLLRVFQTSSVPEFNHVFQVLEQQCQMEADVAGNVVVNWPDLVAITSLASKTFHRMSASGEWANPSRPAAFPASVNQWKPGNCFNCGSDQHMQHDCPHPLNQATIDANKKALAEWRKAHPRKSGSGGGRGSGRGSAGGRGRGNNRGSDRGRGRGNSNSNSLNGKPLRKFASDGKPLKLNEHGLYVIDLARWHKQQKTQTIDNLTALLANGVPGATGPAAASDSTPAAAPAPAPTAATGSAPAPATNDRTARIREAVSRCFGT